MIDTTLSKAEFKKHYGYSESTYQRRMSKFKSNPKFSDGFIQPTTKEVRIDIEVYKEFQKYESDNKFRG